MTTYTLHLTEAQAHVLSRACEVLARLGIGQINEVSSPKGRRIADGFWNVAYQEWSWPSVMVGPTRWMPLPEDHDAQAQPAPVENGKSVHKARERFSNELHCNPDEPYPGMAEAFEHHFSQPFKDGEWHVASRTWAAAWKAAKNHGAQAQPAPSVQNQEWLPIPDKHTVFESVDLQLADGSVLCECLPQADGDYWWGGLCRDVFIDPKHVNVTHWRLSAAPEAKP